MKRSVLLTILVLALGIGLTSAAWARWGYGYGDRCRQPRRCTYRSWTMPSHHWARQHRYDPATVETVRGKVVKVERVAGRGRSKGVHLLVKTDHKTIPVHVGPQWYLRDHDVTFKPGDKIEVSGSRIMFHREPVLIAGQLSQDGHTVKLRNSRGIPLWAGRGRSR
jgi:hypothetical protein